MKVPFASTHRLPVMRIRFMQKGASLLALVLCSLLLAACGRRGPQSPAMPPPEVRTVAVAPQSVTLTTELPGRTTPYLIADIRPQVSGLIQKRLFTEGSDVQAGQVLYQIDPAPFQAAVDTATAALGRTEATLPALQARADRMREALAVRAVSQQDFDNADAALKQAQADASYWKATLESARINLGYARVISPISGRIGRSSVTDGAIVTAYQAVPLATVQQLDPIYVDVPQSTAEMLRLKTRITAGQLAPDTAGENAVKLILDNGAAYPKEGTLQFRDVSVDPTTGSVTLRMVFPNPDTVLMPGMFVRAILKEGVNPGAILIPQQVVSRDPKGNPMAMIVNAGGLIEPRILTIDRAIGSQWLVTSGLVAGDRVVVEGLQKIRPGVAVRESAPAAK